MFRSEDKIHNANKNDKNKNSSYGKDDYTALKIYSYEYACDVFYHIKLRNVTINLPIKFNLYMHVCVKNNL